LGGLLLLKYYYTSNYTSVAGLVLLFKIKLQGKPEYLQDFPYRTRLATGRGIRREENNLHYVTKTSFVTRTKATWRMLPVHIRVLQSVRQFKKILKPWIKENLTI
jgi:hypothetical protein